MRIKHIDDLNHLGDRAKKQIQKAIDAQGGIKNEKRLQSVPLRTKPGTTQKSISLDSIAPTKKSKKVKPKRVMKTAEGLNYCPYPSTDPFVAVHKLLEAKFGMYHDGGRLVNEMIIEGGEINWRFDICLLPTLRPIGSDESRGQPILLIESDGFGFHKSLDQFKGDRKKQTHGLCEGCLVMRITNEDVRQRLSGVIDNIDRILAHERIYTRTYQVVPKGNTQSFFSWVQPV